MNRLQRTSGSLTAILLVALFSVASGSSRPNATGPAVGANPKAPALSWAKTYAVLGASAVTNTGGIVITGDLGVSRPGISPTGFPPGTITGTIHSGDASSAQAQGKLTPAYNSLAAKTCNTSRVLSIPRAIRPSS